MSGTESESGNLVLEDWCDWCADENAELTHKVWVNERDIYLRFCSRSCAINLAGADEQYYDIEKTEDNQHD